MNIIYHIIRIILSVGTILTLIRNEKIYQAHKNTHPTNKIRYIISQTLILTPIHLPHYPTQKQNKIILTLTKVQYLPIPSITNIPSINIIIPNTYIKVPRRGFWGFRQTRQVITPLLYKATQLTI